MTCKRCSYILYGSENYCPHCGEVCRPDEKPQPIQDSEPKPIFISRESAYEDIASRNRIFDPEPPSEELSGENRKKVKSKEKSSSRGIIAFLSVLCVLLSVGAVYTAMNYFDFVPAVADFLSQREITTEITQTTESEFASSLGVILPQINYAPVNCIVSSSKSISLRKGPSESYGQISLIPSGKEVQVIGGSAENESWVYVYVHSEDSYGWVSASFISGNTISEEVKEEK